MHRRWFRCAVVRTLFRSAQSNYLMTQLEKTFSMERVAIPGEGFAGCRTTTGAVKNPDGMDPAAVTLIGKSGSTAKGAV